MAIKRIGEREFQELTARINEAIIKNDGLIGDQKQQVELLMSLERKFQFYVNKYQKTVDIYKKFIDLIVNKNGNILSARTYFREKKGTFSSNITSHIRNGNAKELMNFNANFQLIKFIVDNWGGKLPEKVNGYYKDFLEARRILVENNLPLAINRAKLFYRKTPRSHLTLLDLIDICIYGLISGVDKYVGKYTKVWRSVCIGRMVGFMIEEYSKTFIRMYPTDKKILYRANALKHRLKIESIVELTKAINESFEKDHEEGKKVPKLPIKEVHIRTLLNGSGYISANMPSENDEKESYNLYDVTEDLKHNVEEDIIKVDAIRKVTEASKCLNIMEIKIIKLKGVDL